MLRSNASAVRYGMRPHLGAEQKYILYAHIRLIREWVLLRHDVVHTSSHLPPGEVINARTAHAQSFRFLF